MCCLILFRKKQPERIYFSKYSMTNSEYRRATYMQELLKVPLRWLTPEPVYSEITPKSEHTAYYTCIEADIPTINKNKINIITKENDSPFTSFRLKNLGGTATKTVSRFVGNWLRSVETFKGND